MSKSSVIPHSKNQQLVIIREDYLAICEGDHCAAALLNVFEYWTNVKLANKEQAEIDNAIANAEGVEAKQSVDLWIYKRVPDLKDELLGLFGESKISAALGILHDHGFIVKRTNPRFKWDKTMQYMVITEAIENSLAKIQTRSRKNKASKTLNQVSEGHESKAAIPETTTETTTENNTALERVGVSNISKMGDKQLQAYYEQHTALIDELLLLTGIDVQFVHWGEMDLSQRRTYVKACEVYLSKGINLIEYIAWLKKDLAWRKPLHVTLKDFTDNIPRYRTSLTYITKEKSGAAAPDMTIWRVPEVDDPPYPEVLPNIGEIPF